jgi:hypothetical protein
MPQPCCTFRERTTDTHWIEDWGGSTANMEKEARRKILCPSWGKPVSYLLLYSYLLVSFFF